MSYLELTIDDSNMVDSVGLAAPSWCVFNSADDDSSLTNRTFLLSVIPTVIIR